MDICALGYYKKSSINISIQLCLWTDELISHCQIWVKLLDHKINACLSYKKFETFQKLIVVF